MNEPSWAPRFWSKVDFNGPIPEHRPDLGPCHVWTGSRNERRGGYGQFSVGPRGARRVRKAHQIVLELAGVEIPAGHVPDHLCRNPPCVRREHLEPVTEQINFLRGESPTAIAVRTGMCVKALHEMTKDNTLFTPGRKNKPPRRNCRECRNESQRRRYQDRQARKGIPLANRRPLVEVVREWSLLEAEGLTKRQAAERLDMKSETFIRALWRARREAGES